jgi:DNA repair ATPase RecN
VWKTTNKLSSFSEINSWVKEHLDSIDATEKEIKETEEKLSELKDFSRTQNRHVCTMKRILADVNQEIEKASSIKKALGMEEVEVEG